MKLAETNGRLIAKMDTQDRVSLKKNRIEQILRERGRDASIHDVRSALSGEFKLHDCDFYPIRRKVFGIAKRKPKRTSTKLLKAELSNGITALKHAHKPSQGFDSKVSLDDLRQVKDLADRVGGINQLSSIVGLLAELAS